MKVDLFFSILGQGLGTPTAIHKLLLNLDTGVVCGLKNIHISNMQQLIDFLE